MGHADISLEFANQAIQVEPDSVAGPLARAEIYLLQGKFDLAVEDATYAIERRPLEPRGNRILGIAALWRNDLSGAISHLTIAISMDGSIDAARQYRAIAYFMSGRFEESIEDLEVALSDEPNDPTVNSYLAWALAICPDERLRDGTQALAHAKKACALTGRSFNGLAALGAAYAELGEFEKATDCIEDAMKVAKRVQERRLAQSLLKLFRANIPYRSVRRQEWPSV